MVDVWNPLRRRWKAFPPLFFALAIVAIPVFAPPVVASSVVPSGFIPGRRRISSFVRWRPWAAKGALPDGVACWSVAMVPARLVE